jgi:hypothetical protein
MAIRDSVTVSISDEITGMCNFRLSEIDVDGSASRGRISEYSVAKDTSSKVSAVGALALKKAEAGR